ncbi:hypothetical protein IQ215_05095 [Cyanobacterium stanieri LEGE 03274]|uniref:Uncharacterized protein n=1 Tax=Cyanobacterium stanieri LEGE 03274 TaxID=1828756 RepID=A0ABR9V2G9_9CHRO|nr:hypothetical protein [Cyanobacterium stanieri]MBE9222068.1 hypothetical protein [Cyanobacterium stanieri LEGE 03274]
MSKFFNLESYIEYCQYAQIFVENINLNHKNKQDLLLEYKHFIDRNKNIEFLEFPFLPSLLPSQLTPSHQSRISKEKLGFFIEDNREEEIFIIPPINAFGLSLLRASYLFSPVFYYWNFVDDIIKFDNLDKPLIIYNLDDFTPSQIIPLTSESHPKSNYSIPIIDTRNLDNYQYLKLSFMYEERCDPEGICYVARIFSRIAQNILKQLKLDITLKKDLIKYLQKINIFKLINSQQDNNITSFPIIIYLGEKFYHYHLNGEEIKEIISKELPLQELNKIIENNQDKYNFLVISSYDLPLVNTSLSSYGISVKTDNFKKFKDIWLEAKNQEFPLYGQHLDKISFFVAGEEKNQEIEISLPEKICYQGEKEEKIYGEYYSKNNQEFRQEFTMSNSSVYLPFTINGEYLIDEQTSKKIIYKIENQYYDGNKDKNLLIKICFILQPGKPPKLEVIDQYNRVLNSFLENKPELDNLVCISTKNMSEFTRNNLSNAGLDKISENYLYFEQILLNIKEKLSNIKSANYNSSYFIRNAQEIRKLRLDANNNFPPILNSIPINSEKHLNQILNIYFDLEDVINKNLSRLRGRIPHSIRGENALSINNVYLDILLFLGKSYGLTQNMSLNYLFDSNILNLNNVKSFKEHLQNMARLACVLNRQKQYFNLFSNYSQKEDKEFYKIEAYLWGYARILLWYLNFEEANKWLNYKQHFSDIIHYCLTLNYEENRNKGYFQNALICLVYLLTFREINYDFVLENSHHYELAKQLVNKLENYQIRSKLVNHENDGSLNELFARLLDGNATGDDIPKPGVD